MGRLLTKKRDTTFDSTAHRGSHAGRVGVLRCRRLSWRLVEQGPHATDSGSNHWGASGLFAAPRLAPRRRALARSTFFLHSHWDTTHGQGWPTRMYRAIPL